MSPEVVHGDSDARRREPPKGRELDRPHQGGLAASLCVIRPAGTHRVHISYLARAAPLFRSEICPILARPPVSGLDSEAARGRALRTHPLHTRPLALLVPGRRCGRQVLEAEFHIAGATLAIVATSGGGGLPHHHPLRWPALPRFEHREGATEVATSCG